jgi:hypothetical protein
MRKTRNKSKDSFEAKPFREVNVRVWVAATLPLFILSVLFTAVVFEGEYAVYLDEKREREKNDVTNRFVYEPRTFNGLCPSGSTPFDETRCLRLKKEE